MIDREYIEKNIDIIFELEKRNITNNKIFHYVQTFEKEDLTKEIDFKRPRSCAYISPPPVSLMDLELNPANRFELEWDTYTYLKKLYNKVEHFPGCRNIFLRTIEKKLSILAAIAVPIHIHCVDTVYTNYKLHSNASLAFYFC